AAEEDRAAHPKGAEPAADELSPLRFDDEEHVEAAGPRAHMIAARRRAGREVRGEAGIAAGYGEGDGALLAGAIRVVDEEGAAVLGPGITVREDLVHRKRVRRISDEPDNDGPPRVDPGAYLLPLSEEVLAHVGATGARPQPVPHERPSRCGQGANLLPPEHHPHRIRLQLRRREPAPVGPPLRRDARHPPAQPEGPPPPGGSPHEPRTQPRPPETHADERPRREPPPAPRQRGTTRRKCRRDGQRDGPKPAAQKVEVERRPGERVREGEPVAFGNEVEAALRERHGGEGWGANRYTSKRPLFSHTVAARLRRPPRPPIIWIGANHAPLFSLASPHRPIPPRPCPLSVSPCSSWPPAPRPSRPPPIPARRPTS